MRLFFGIFRRTPPPTAFKGLRDRVDSKVYYAVHKLLIQPVYVLPQLRALGVHASVARQVVHPGIDRHVACRAVESHVGYT